jgi:hypothetical protein
MTAGGAGRRRWAGWPTRLGLAAASLVASLVIADAVVKWLRLDDRLMAGAYLLQRGDVAVHRVATDPILQYELNPGSSCTCGDPGSRRGPYRVTIDQFGARYPAHRAEKEPRVFRILAFGGSTLYGAGVNDEETVPAALERRLNAELAGDAPSAPRRFEVWNYGTPGYTLLQAAHLAHKLLRTLDPDLLLVHLHNRGPRPIFLPPEADVRDIRAMFTDDPYFVDEQFPPPAWLPATLHHLAFEHSAIYRVCAGVVRHRERARSVFEHIEYSDFLDRKEAQALNREAAERGVPVYYVPLPPTPRTHADDWFPGLPPEQMLLVDKPGAPPAFYETHPDPWVLDEYAALLVVALREPIAAAQRRDAAAASAPPISAPAQ